MILHSKRRCAQSCLILCDPMDYSQAPLSMEFSRQEYWNGLGFSPARDFLHPGLGPTSLVSPALVGGLFITVLLANVYRKDYLFHGLIPE